MVLLREKEVIILLSMTVYVKHLIQWKIGQQKKLIILY